MPSTLEVVEAGGSRVQAILGYIASLMPEWDTRDPRKKRKKKGGIKEDLIPAYSTWTKVRE